MPPLQMGVISASCFFQLRKCHRRRDSDDGSLALTGCGKAAWCWYDENERMRCHPSRPLDDLKQIARTAIDCPTGDLLSAAWTCHASWQSESGLSAHSGAAIESMVH
jgi:hypothetical protein